MLKRINRNSKDAFTRYHRTIAIEQLEARDCPVFCSLGLVGTTLTFQGDSVLATRFVRVLQGTPDQLDAIYVKNGTIWFYTTQYSDYIEFNLDTGVSAPTATTPISIVIKGGKKDDKVNLQSWPLNTPTNTTGNMFGFAPGSVSSLSFWGESGDDFFSGPEGPGPGLPGAVKLTSSSIPNIAFYGGTGDDEMNNNGDPEIFFGAAGNDKAMIGSRGGDGKDALFGGSDNDILWGGKDNDYIGGNDGRDLLYGGLGDDIIEGGSGSDKMWGHEGNDSINTGVSGTTLAFDPATGIPNGTYAEFADGGPDDDSIDGQHATGSVYLDVGPGTGIPGTYQHAMGGQYADMILGSDVDDVLLGGGSSDTIEGNDGHDIIWGDDGGDTLNGGAGFDWIWGGSGPDTIDGGADDDMITSGDPSMAIGPSDQFYNGVGVPGLWWALPDMFGAGGGGNNTVDGHEEPLGGGGYGGPAGGIGGGATGLGNTFGGAAGAPMNVAAPGVLGNSSGKRAQLSQPPAYGDLTLNEDGSFTYTPDPDFVGVDIFLFVAIDIATSAESPPIPIILQIVGEPGASEENPVASEDVISAPMDGGATTGALESFENADAVEVVDGFEPQHGTLVLNPDGTYTYTPDAGFVGTDSFQYVATNTTTQEQSAPATVTIVVHSTQPQGHTDGYWMYFGQPSLVVPAPGVLTNDPWGDTAQLVTTSPVSPANGTVTMNPDGSFTYTPNPGFRGEDHFLYKAINSATGQQSGNIWVGISVVQVEAVPDVYATRVNTPLGVGTPNGAGLYGLHGVLYNDEWTTEAYQVQGNGPGPHHGTLSFNHDGSFSYSPDTGFSGMDVFQYQAVDKTQTPWEWSAPATVTIWVLPNEPQGSPAYEYTTAAGNDYSADVASGLLSDDPWADSLILLSGTEHLYGNLYAGGAVGGTIVSGGYYFKCQYLDTDGEFTFDLTEAGYSGDVSFQYVAINTLTGQSALRVATIHFVGPVANDDYASSAPGTDAEGNLLANDQWANRAYVVTGPNHGSFYSFDDDTGAFVYRPNEGFEGYDSFQYRAQNSVSGQESALATVTIYIGYDPLTLNRPAVVSNEPVLMMSQLAAINEEAVRRWRIAGVSDATLRDALGNVQFVIADLPGSHLGGATADGRILIDVNAAGHGWFVDPTPRDDSEFRPHAGRSQLRASRESAAIDNADLLTVVMHEIGHVLGLDHARASDNIMADTIDLGVRRLPTAADAALVDLLFSTRGRRRR